MMLCLLQFNFVGRILGPRGLTAKQLEKDTQCKIMIRGKGSTRDKQKVSLSGFEAVAHVQNQTSNCFVFAGISEQG